MNTECKVLDLINEISDLTKARYRDSVRPIYGMCNEDSQPDFIGSCTLVSLENEKYVVTAAHVLDHLSEKSLYVLQDDFELLAGKLLITEAPEGDREKDKIDLAIVRLDDKDKRLFRDSQFIEIDVNEGTHANEHGTYATVLGYPLSKHKKSKSSRNRIKLQMYCYTDSYDRNNNSFKRLGFSSDTHALVHHNQQTVKNSRGEKISSYGVEGVSGGGAFSTATLNQCQEVQSSDLWNTELAGILIERSDDGKHLVFVSTAVICHAISLYQ